MKIGIVGSGLVGATAAYALVMRGVGREIVLVDKNEARAQAEADDILHAVPFAHPLQVRAGGFRDLTGSRVVIMAAGVGQRPGETRLQLLERNTAVFAAVVPEIFRYAPEANLIVATNPVDVMTHLSVHFARQLGVADNQVLGSGTTLDTARYRALLGSHLGVDAEHVHGYVIGEHGDSEVLTWSLTTVGNMPLDDYCRERQIGMDDAVRAEIDHRVRRAAYHIIDGKGATYYGIGSALARITNSILRDQRSVLTVCAPQAEVAGVRDVTLALPHIVGGAGVIDTLSLPLTPDEEAALNRSASVIRSAIDELEAAGALG